MRKLALVPLVFVTAVLAADSKKTTSMAPTHLVVTPEAMQWVDVPPVLPPGAKMTVLEGDPSKKGFFVIRAKMPDGYRIAPHWHPTRERITVISGTLHLAMGDTFDTSKGDAMAAGSFGYMNARMHHYAWTEGPTEIQVAAQGPFQLNYVNPKDDPSKAAKAGK